jgi:hypothetical protein
MPPAVPEPRNPRRMTWAEVPDAVVTAIAERAGSAVVGAEGSTHGFSPGFAGVVQFESGALFIKAMSATRDPWSIEFNRREPEVLALLPDGLPVPRLRWTLDLDEWFVFATEAVDGNHPESSTSAAHANEVWAALGVLGRTQAPTSLPPFHERHADLFSQWRLLADAEDSAQRLEGLGADGEWIAANLPRLLAWEADAIEVTKGDVLVHGDLRADNLLLTAEGIVIVDWPHASRGSAWIDLAGFLPAHEMYGGARAREAFRSHPLARDVSENHELLFVATLAGYFTVQSTEPPVPALPGLREFQRAQALPALAWLRELA